MIEMYTTGETTITESQLNDLEKYFGVKFPQAYRDFMLIANGGIPLHCCFNFKDGTDGSTVSFYTVSPGNRRDIVGSNKAREQRLPRGFVSIGDDDNGNEICIDCNEGQGYGKIHFWDHENEADAAQGETPETVGNTLLIDDTFAEFLEGLHDVELLDLPKGYLEDDPIAGARFKALMKPEHYWLDD
ncbi:MAG: SMI1/KNR4 family protein [Candidatus Obscuribacterales bacterium]|nr:SMI1/KNR4 family protein [Candidatus Obscuribacterales bacterium]